MRNPFGTNADLLKRIFESNERARAALSTVVPSSQPTQSQIKESGTIITDDWGDPITEKIEHVKENPVEEHFEWGDGPESDAAIKQKIKDRESRAQEEKVNFERELSETLATAAGEKVIVPEEHIEFDFGELEGASNTNKEEIDSLDSSGFGPSEDVGEDISNKNNDNDLAEVLERNARRSSEKKEKVAPYAHVEHWGTGEAEEIEKILRKAELELASQDDHSFLQQEKKPQEPLPPTPEAKEGVDAKEIKLLQELQAKKQEEKRERMAKGVSVTIRRSSGEVQDGKFIEMVDGGALVFFDDHGTIYKKVVPFSDLIAMNPHLLQSSNNTESKPLEPEEKVKPQEPPHTISLQKPYKKISREGVDMSDYAEKKELRIPDIVVPKVSSAEISVPELENKEIQVPQITTKEIKIWPLEDVSQNISHVEWPEPAKDLPLASQNILRENLARVGGNTDTLWDGNIRKEEVVIDDVSTSEAFLAKRTGQRSFGKKESFVDEFPNKEIPLTQRKKGSITRPRETTITKKRGQVLKNIGADLKGLRGIDAFDAETRRLAEIGLSEGDTHEKRAGAQTEEEELNTTDIINTNTMPPNNQDPQENTPVPKPPYATDNVQLSGFSNINKIQEPKITQVTFEDEKGVIDITDTVKNNSFYSPIKGNPDVDTKPNSPIEAGVDVISDVGQNKTSTTQKTDTSGIKKIDWNKVQSDFDTETQEINKIKSAREQLQESLLNKDKAKKEVPLEEVTPEPVIVVPTEKIDVNTQIENLEKDIDTLKSNLDFIYKTAQNAQKELPEGALKKESLDWFKKHGLDLVSEIESKEALLKALREEKDASHTGAKQTKKDSSKTYETQSATSNEGGSSRQTQESRSENRQTPDFLKENDGQMSSFEKKIAEQNTVSDLCSLLLSRNFKNIEYGIGKDAVKGKVLAEKIAETVWNAEIGTKIDTTLFIPEPVIAQRVEEILRNSIEWVELESEDGGRPIFQKIESQVKDPNVRDSLSKTSQKVAGKTKPGVLKRVKNWIGANKKKTVAGALGLPVGSYFIPKIFNILLALATPQTANIPQNNVLETSNRLETPTEATPRTGNGEGVSVGNKATLKVENGVPVVTVPAKKPGVETPANPNQTTQQTTTPVKAPVSTGVRAVNPDTETKNETNGGGTGINTVNPDTANTTGGSTGINLINPDAVALSESGSNEPKILIPTGSDSNSNDGEILIETTPNKQISITEAEKSIPQSIESSHDLKKRLSQIGLLDSYARLSTVGLDLTKKLDDDYKKATLGRIKTIEERLDGSPRTSAVWFETFMHQPKATMLNDKKGANRPTLDRAYKRNIMNDGEQVRALPSYNLDDNSFYFSNNLYEAFDAWYNNTIKPVSKNLEGRLTPDEAAYLSNKNISTGEYLARILDLAKKYGVQTTVPEVTPATVERMLSSISDQNLQENNSFDQNQAPEKIVSFENPGNARWAVDALRYAEDYRINDKTDLMSWLNGPYYQMVREFREQESVGTSYTKNELAILKSTFERLSKTIELKTNAAKYDGLLFSNLGTSGKNEQQEVAAIIKKIDEKLSQF